MRRLLAHPLTRDLDLDDPRTTALRRRILAEKTFLRCVYEDWYRSLAAVLPADGPVLELGTGAGFLGRFVPHLLTSEVVPIAGVDLVLDGRAWPVAAGRLAGVAMTNVFHHVPDPARLLAEAARAVRPGGVLAMVEPWRTAFSERVYRRLHHEPFEPGAADWRLPPGGPLSAANGALPWIVFARDRQRLEREHPAWRIASITPTMPLRYLLSGGLAWRPGMPGWSYPLWRRLDEVLVRRWPSLALFARVVLERRPAVASGPLGFPSSG